MVQDEINEKIRVIRFREVRRGLDNYCEVQLKVHSAFSVGVGKFIWTREPSLNVGPVGENCSAVFLQSLLWTEAPWAQTLPGSGQPPSLLVRLVRQGRCL